MGRLSAVAALATLFVVAGCGGSSSNTLDSILKRPGPEVAVAEGAGDFSAGAVRYPFLVIQKDGRPVNRASARLWLATGRGSRPFQETTARLEPIGIPGESEPAAGGVTKIYVAHLRIPKPGRYWLVAEPDGAKIQAVGVFNVRRRSQSPAVGARAPDSPTPTLAGAHGRVSALTTRQPPDLALLHYSVAGSLAAHKPFVVTFATPRFCTSRTCGPVVDVVNAVRKRYARDGVRFIHVEVYEKNDPSRGYNRWMRQWGLASEPWVFLVGRDGRIKGKFEGSVSVPELASAVQRLL